MIASPYRLAAVKTWNTFDGSGYTCTLLRGTVRVAECHHAGNGGEVQVHFQCAEEGAMLDDYLAGLPDVDAGDGFTFRPDYDWFIAALVDGHELRRVYTRDAKRYVMYVNANGVLHRIDTKKATQTREHLNAHIRLHAGQPLDDMDPEAAFQAWCRFAVAIAPVTMAGGA
jgi:hypothetical protein